MAFRAKAKGQYIRQEVANGISFTGERTSHAAGRDAPTVVNDIVLQFDRNSADGEGLIEFEPFMSNPKQSVFVSWVRVIVGPTIGWSVYITDGDESVGAPNVDNPSLDAPVSSGTGNALIAVNRDLPPKAKIRVTSSAVTSTFGIVEVEFFTTLDKFERVIN